MQPVHLTRRITLEDPQTISDGAGGAQESWAPLGSLWADMRAGTGSPTGGAAVDLSRVRWRVVVRAAPVGSPRRPRPGQRFREGARVFPIVAVAERDPTGRYLTCFAEERLVQ